jgi:glycosidase
MRIGEITHRCAFNDCYPIDDSKVRINIKTGKDVDKVYIIHADPYINHISGGDWKGEREVMSYHTELRSHKIFSIILQPKYKREQYFFELHSKGEILYLFEDDFYEAQDLNIKGKSYQYFKYAWLNPSDVFEVPEWVSDIIWYQIFPERFCRGDMRAKKEVTKPWRCEDNMSYWDFYGGDIKGVNSKLDYLKDLGISGLYLTPIMESSSNHKYNTNDYERIDPDFGNEEDLKILIEQAHKRGMRVMLDAVFNHSGNEFKPWKDVLKHGKESPYYDWFFINQWPMETDYKKNWYDSYYSFAFASGMPKLNTNHPKVIQYFTDLCKHWVRDWNIDGIRFDVGNEVSHTFLREVRREVKNINPDIYLLGEIWQDSARWLQGDQYDSVMNYPFIESINEFCLNKKRTAKDFMYSMNRCYTLYQEQVNKVLFNFLDSHDVDRAVTRFQSQDALFQQLTILMTMEGTPSIYYGTEIAMEGGEDPLNRKCMPWQEIEAGKYEDITNQVKKLITIRNEYSVTRSGNIEWVDTSETRLIHYRKKKDDGSEVLEVIINGNEEEVVLRDDVKRNVLFARHFENGTLKPGGVMVCIPKE